MRVLGRLVLVSVIATAFGLAIRYLPPGFGGWRVEPGAVVPRAGHAHSVSALTLGRDGRLVASADVAGEIRVWRTDGALLAQLQAEAGPVRALALSTAGAKLASIDEKGTLAVHDLMARTARAQTSGVHDVVALAFVDPMGDRLLAIGDRLLQVEVREGGLEVRGAKSPGDASVPVTAGLVLGTDRVLVARGEQVFLWDDGEIVARHQAPGAVTAFAAAADGRVAIAGAFGVAVAERLDGKPGVAPWHRLGAGHEAAIAVAFTRDGSLVSAHANGEVGRWSGSCRNEQADRSFLVPAAVFGHARHWATSADGRVQAAVGLDGIVNVQVAGEPRRVLGAPTLTLAIAPRGDWVATSHGSGAVGAGLVQLRTRRGPRVVANLWLDRPASCLAFSNDGAWLGMRFFDGSVRSWQPHSGAVREGRAPGVPEVCPAPHDRRFSVTLLKQAGEDEELFLRDGRTDLLLPLGSGYRKAIDVGRRTFGQRLLGRFGLVGVRTDDALVVASVRPALPMPVLLISVVPVALVPRLLRRLTRRSRA